MVETRNVVYDERGEQQVCLLLKVLPIQNSDDVLKFSVSLKNSFHVHGGVVMIFADDQRIQNFDVLSSGSTADKYREQRFYDLILW
jgi:hypothetical protein